MNYEEKLIRFIASKLIQKKYFLRKHCFPTEGKLANLITIVLDDLLEEYKKFRLIRIKSESGLVTPIIQKSVDKLVL